MCKPLEGENQDTNESMQLRLMDFLCCPNCKQDLELIKLAVEDNEISEGILYCQNQHFFPIVRGIPRMLPSSIKENWDAIKEKIPQPTPEPIKILVEKQLLAKKTEAYDKRTKANFSEEWDKHEVGDNTWTMELDERIEWYFLDPLKMTADELKGKIVLDGGCGNGSQSVVYTKLGLEVIAMDLSTGLEKGYAFRHKYPQAKPDKVHYIQGDLQNPPLKPKIVDIIHSAGVLHHTPNTEKTFRALRPLLKDGGTFYVWLYKYEKIVTPVVNTIRAVTTRIPAPIFSKIADVMAVPFIGFCWTVDKLGIRRYHVTPTRRESALALLDIFGAPYAHYHSFEEVTEWYKSVGITDIWPGYDGRRGFGICGRMPAQRKEASTAKV